MELYRKMGFHQIRIMILNGNRINLYIILGLGYFSKAFCFFGNALYNNLVFLTVCDFFMRARIQNEAFFQR